MNTGEALLKLEFEDENMDFSSVEFEVIPPENLIDDCRSAIAEGLRDVDEKLFVLNSKISELNNEIDSLTNHADKLDYTIAVASGILTGLLDSFFVGEWDFKTAKAISNKEVNDLVMRKAKEQGYTGTRLDGAIAKLEEKFVLSGDNDWKGANIGVSAASHHLDDFSHHPTPVGLVCAILSQFTEQAFYSNKDGEFSKIPISISKNKFVGKNVPSKLFCGVINWAIAVIQTKHNWEGHLFSDMAGSKNTAGAGMGIPGPMLSTLKELSALPLFNETDLPMKIHKAFTKGIGTGGSQLDLGALNVLFEGASSKMDFRTEKAISHELTRQAIPVLINEAVVRGFYFLRRLFLELKLKKSIDKINWNIVLPFKNRTIVRMLTISIGTFMAIDLADAGIRAAIKAKGFNPETLRQFILRVNFVGIGRFAIAVVTDAGMGIKKYRKESERSELLSEQISLSNVKLYYKNADVMCSFTDLYKSQSHMHNHEAQLWIEVKNTAESMKEFANLKINVEKFFLQKITESMDIYNRMGTISLVSIEGNNPGLLEDIFRR